VDWDTALDIAARGLRQAGSAVGILASGKYTNEENYLLNKLARQVLGVNNIDLCSHLYAASVVAGLAESAGLHSMSTSLIEIADRAASFFVIGSNLTEQHPVFGARIRQAILRRKLKMIVASPDFINIAEYAALPLYHHPNTETALVNGLIHILLERGWANLASAAGSDDPSRLNDFKALIDRYTPQHVAEITGLTVESLYQAAEILAQNRPTAVLWSVGLTNSTVAEANVQSLINLQLILGNLNAPGGGLAPLRSQANSQGASDMGAHPYMLPGYQPIVDGAVRAKFAASWGAPIASAPGLSAPEMLAAARQGHLKALYILGEDLLNTSPEAVPVRQGLSACDLVILHEIAPSETARYADIHLPGVSFAEKSGTFTSTERRIQSVRQAIQPIGDARPDWQIIAALAQRILATDNRKIQPGSFAGWDYANTDQILAEIAALAPLYDGLTFDNLAGGAPVCWSAPPPTPRLHPVEQAPVELATVPTLVLA
jgi:formate dehydrogenase major subunit/formate dehydrogenase alpha subunit